MSKIKSAFEIAIDEKVKKHTKLARQKPFYDFYEITLGIIIRLTRGDVTVIRLSDNAFKPTRILDYHEAMKESYQNGDVVIRDHGDGNIDVFCTDNTGIKIMREIGVLEANSLAVSSQIAHIKIWDKNTPENMKNRVDRFFEKAELLIEDTKSFMKDLERGK